MVDEVRSKRRKTNNMDRLSDELLMEVLCRLPCSKTAVMCKSVCKHWCAIISHAYFVSRFVAHKASNKVTSCAHGDDRVSKYDQTRMKMMSDRTFGLVVRRECVKTWKGLIIRFNDPINDPRSVSFSRLPKLVNQGVPPSLTVIGAYNDLLLYQRHGCVDFDDDKLELYITNAQTRQWLALPLLHLQIRTWQIGFICDPYYSNITNFIPNDAFRATVVVIHYTPETVSEFHAHLFSPHTKGLWRNVVLSLPLKCELLAFSPLFCIASKLYFHCRGSMIGFDPFVDDDVIKCHSIRKPPSLVSTTSFFGVFHEKLYMCDREDTGRYRVWVLDDYEAGKWSLRHSVMGQDWIPLDRRLSKLVKKKPCFGVAIGFHPADPDVIYVVTRRWIVLSNLSTRKMEILSNLPIRYQDLFPVSTSFQVTLPIWPTPLPKFVQTGDVGEVDK